jgi:hypothetical protein
MSPYGLLVAVIVFLVLWLVGAGLVVSLLVAVLCGLIAGGGIARRWP